MPVKLALPSPHFCCHLHSPQRAKQSAEVILDCLTTSSLQTSDNLMEIAAVGGMLLQDVRDKFPEDYRRWQQCLDELRMVVPQDREQGTLPSPSPVRTGAILARDSILPRRRNDSNSGA